jgi:hypothetical protein
MNLNWITAGLRLLFGDETKSDLLEGAAALAVVAPLPPQSAQPPQPAQPLEDEMVDEMVDECKRDD